MALADDCSDADDGRPVMSPEGGLEEEDEGSQGFSDTNSVRGAASLTAREMSKAIGAKERHLSQRQTNMLNAASRDARESLLLKARDVVGRLGLDPAVREEVTEKVEVLAARMKRWVGKDEGSPRLLKESEAALVATVRVMQQSYGWSIDRVARKISEADRRIVAVDDLKVNVMLDGATVTNGDGSGAVSLRVGGEERGAKVLDNGGGRSRRLLRVRAYATDDGALLEISGASICASLERRKKEGGGGARAFCPADPRRLDVLDAHRAVVRLAGGGGNSFEALKLVERVELGGGDSDRLICGAGSAYEPSSTPAASSAGSRERVRLLLRRYKTEKLPLTEYLASGAGALMTLRTRYCERFAERFDPARVRERLKNHSGEDGDPLLRSPRLLAHEAIRQADEEVFASLPEHLKLTVRRLAAERNLHGMHVGVRGFLVEGELKAWEER
ncbi:MAG: hypothetical protein JRN07_04070 [Nitrososphaerota archaeon]|nr:hypothetical protein [Nitrososphaerota archaeon]